MTLQAFLTAYRAMLRQYAPWACDYHALESYMRKVSESIAGRDPRYDLTTSPIACETWRRLNCDGALTMEKLAALP